jgi:hypothetical protein
MPIRAIREVHTSTPTMEGAGVHLHRAFGFHDVKQFDPFLLMDDFRGDSPDQYKKGFPWHPHRGIETITYVLAGRVAHGDSIGNSGVIGAGDVQWMTAGSGIIHQEMPEGDSEGRMHGFQLWANLPAANKMMEPRYQEFAAADIPQVTVEDGVSVRVVCGEAAGVSGPVRNVMIEPEYLDVSVPPRTTFRHAVPNGHTVIAYVYEGSGYFDEERDPYHYNAEPAKWVETERTCRMGNRSLILYERDGDEVQVTTEDEPVRFLFFSGKPLGEPIAWYGPIVMNTQEELRTAFREFQNGTFLKAEKK